jgi:hypothetical protein
LHRYDLELISSPSSSYFLLLFRSLQGLHIRDLFRAPQLIQISPFRL